MSQFNEILRHYVNMSYDELLSTANESLAELCSALSEFFKDYSGEDPTADILMLLLANCLGADGQLTDLECRFVNDLLEANHSRDTILSLIHVHKNAEAEHLLDSLMGAMNPAASARMLAVCLCILAVDETITRDEVALVTRLLD